MRNLLVTGFEPFGGDSLNPSFEAVRRLPEELAGLRVIGRCLPTVFGAAPEVLRAAVTEVEPVLALCVGQADGRAEINLERVALNLDDARIPDNEGAQPLERTIIAGAPAAYLTTFPVHAIVAGLGRHGIPARVSGTAGTFVCNHVFFALSHLIATERPWLRGGFVHVPFLPEQVATRHPGSPSMAVELVVRALALAIEISIAEIGAPAGRAVLPDGGVKDGV